MKVVAAIWWLVSYKSPIVQKHKPENRLKEVKLKLGLPDGWRLTEDVKQAIREYDELQHSAPSVRILMEMQQSLQVSARVIKVMRNNLERELGSIEEQEMSIEESRATANTILEMVDELIKIGNKVPEAINKLQELEEQITQEFQQGKNIVGKGTIGLFEDAPQ